MFFTLKLPSVLTFNSQIEVGATLGSFKWNHAINVYLENYNSDKCQEELDSILLKLTDITAKSNDICKLFYKYIESAIEGSFNKVSSIKSSKFLIKKLGLIIHVKLKRGL